MAPHYNEMPDAWYLAHGRLPRDAQLAKERAASLRRHKEKIDRRAILARDGHRCRYCASTNKILAVDHIVPFSRGGSADPSNLAAACKSCNSRKKDRTPEEAGMQLLPIGVA